MVEWLFGNLIRVCTKMLGSVLCPRLAGRNLDYLLLWERVTTVLYPLVVIGMCMLLSILDAFRFMVWPLFKSSAMIVKALDVCILHFFFIFAAGALLFFALLGLSGCFITCYDRRVRNDLAQPCRELCLCCCQPGYNSTPLFAVICTTDAYKTFLFSCVIVGICIY